MSVQATRGYVQLGGCRLPEIFFKPTVIPCRLLLLEGSVLLVKMREDHR